MAEEKNKPEASEQSAKGGGGSGMIPALLVIVLMPVISFAMFKFLFIPMIKSELPEQTGVPALRPDEVVMAPAVTAQSFSTDFENVVTNVKGTSHTRFVQVSFTVYSANPNLEALVASNRPRMMDVAISVLGNLTLAELERREIKNVVRNQLKQGFDHVLGRPLVEEIYFSQFVIQ